MCDTHNLLCLFSVTYHRLILVCRRLTMLPNLRDLKKKLLAYKMLVVTFMAATLCEDSSQLDFSCVVVVCV